MRVAVDADAAIPEIGVGGYTNPASGAVLISLELHSEWFFGSGDIPRWADYTIGVTWVRDFLAAHEDVDVVAATLLPAETIISG